MPALSGSQKALSGLEQSLTSLPRANMRALANKAASSLRRWLEIALDKRVTFWAMRLGRVSRGNRVASEQVVAMRERPDMCRAHAVPNATGVVEFVTIRYQTDEPFICESVAVDGLVTAEREHRITTRCLAACPQPATIAIGND